MTPPRKPLVYIAGPISLPDPIENTHHAIRLGLRLRDAYDIAVLIPHATITCHLVDPRPIDYWYRFDLDQLAHCDALYRIPGASVGADAEVRYAQERGLPVFFEERELGQWLTQERVA